MQGLQLNFKCMHGLHLDSLQGLQCDKSIWIVTLWPSAHMSEAWPLISYVAQPVLPQIIVPSACWRLTSPGSTLLENSRLHASQLRQCSGLPLLPWHCLLQMCSERTLMCESWDAA